MWFSLLVEQSLDEQFEGQLKASEFSQIWYVSSTVVFKIQLCLKPNFSRCYLHLCPSGNQMKPIPVDWPKNKTEMHREKMERLVNDRAKTEVTRPFRSLEDDNDKDVKRQQLGELLATIPMVDVCAETSDTMTHDTAPLVQEETRRKRFSKTPESRNY